jgi:hypothetical protein
MGPFQFPSLFGDANVDALVEGDNQRRILLEGEPVAGAAPSDVAGTINTTWAGWSGSSSATVSHPATINTTWAGWSGTAAAVVEHPATIVDTWPGWVGTAVAVETATPAPPSGGGNTSPTLSFKDTQTSTRRQRDDEEVLLLIAL